MATPLMRKERKMNTKADVVNQIMGELNLSREYAEQVVDWMVEGHEVEYDERAGWRITDRGNLLFHAANAFLLGAL